MNSTEIFDTAIDFLTNGAELPDVVKDDPRSSFLAACLREMNTRGLSNEIRSKKNCSEIRVLKGLGIGTGLFSGGALLLLVFNFLEIL